MEFYLPRSALPDDKIERRILLDEYFPQGLVPFESLTGEGWKISCFTPTESSYFVDPRIEKSLQSWPENLRLDSIETHWKTYKNASFSFIDSWSLNYWSIFYAWLRSKSLSPLNLTVIHVDDHLDQASPHLIDERGSLTCAFSKKTFDFNDPASVKEAIINKSVGIGSFFPPLLHALKSVNVLHLKYSHKGNSDAHGLRCIFTEDKVLAPGRKRPAIVRGEPDTAHKYMVASNPLDLVDKARDSEYIFLHLDCDAFNNRYNGDGLWHTQRPSIDLNLNEIKQRIVELFSLLSSLSNRIYMNVALSPGFFPSEYWEPILQHVFEKGLEYNLVRDDEFSQYLKLNYSEVVIDEIFN